MEDNEGELNKEIEDASEVTFVEEAAELTELVTLISESKGAPLPTEYKRFKQILDRYQEQPQLLDPHIEGMVTPLTAALRELASETETIDLSSVQRVSHAVHILSTVRGHKTIAQFFPHEAADVEPVVALLLLTKEAAPPSGAVILDDAEDLCWETQCILLLWLSILVLIPFDLATVDTSLAAPAEGRREDTATLVERIVQVSQDFLSDPGKVRDMAAVVLSKLLTRPDMGALLHTFLDWAFEVLASDKQDMESVFRLPGAALSVASIFKQGGRDILLPVAERTLDAACALAASPSAERNGLVRKLAVRLISRCGLTFLAPRVAAWRYQRGSRSLLHNLLESSGKTAPSSEAVDPSADESEEDFEVPEKIEDVVEQLLSGLRDKDTVVTAPYPKPSHPGLRDKDTVVTAHYPTPSHPGLRDKDTMVRWGAAKGIGRMTGRLPLSFADDVVGAVLDLFKPSEEDGAWHGGCLALAELARRGLLLPERLEE
eukprot:gene10531-12462_t